MEAAPPQQVLLGCPWGQGASFRYCRRPSGRRDVAVNQDLKKVLAAVGRFLAYGLLAAFPVLVLRQDILVLGNAVGEDSLVEACQLVLLAMSVLAFGLLAWWRADDRRFAVLAAVFFASMLIRENDALLDVLLFHGAWKFLVAPLVIASLAWALGDVRALLGGLARFVSSHAGTIMLLGLAILLCFSRLFGMTEIWASVLGDGYVRTAKNAIEETGELLGYTFILAASLRYLARRVKAQVRERRGLGRAAPSAALSAPNARSGHSRAG